MLKLLKPLKKNKIQDPIYMNEIMILTQYFVNFTIKYILKKKKRCIAFSSEMYKDNVAVN